VYLAYGLPPVRLGQCDRAYSQFPKLSEQGVLGLEIMFDVRYYRVLSRLRIAAVTGQPVKIITET
jgi:hypothetical protein